MHQPGFKHSRRCFSHSVKGGEGEKTEPRQRVQMVATSRCFTDRNYVIRKPLFSSEPQMSILKKPHPEGLVDKEKHLHSTRRGQTVMKSWTRLREELIPESYSFLYKNVCLPTASSEESGSPRTISEHTALLPATRLPQHTFSSSILKVQKVDPPLRPPLTSTVLYSTYTPRSGHSRLSQTQLRQEGREGGGGWNDNQWSYGGHSKERPHQANYWACAIPKTLPPSPDRQSAAWSPHKEYQALLDYTYPLKPRQGVSKWDNNAELQDDARLQTESHLQDSGIGLDHLGSSTSVSRLDLLASETEHIRERRSLSACQRSPDQQGFSCSSGDQPYNMSLSLSNTLAESLDILDCSNNRGGTSKSRGNNSHPQHHALSFTSTASPSCTSVLPQSRYVCRELEEEFCALPERLEVLQLMATQVWEVTAQIKNPGTASISPPTTLMDRQTTDNEADRPEFKEGKYEGTELGREQRSFAQTAAGSRDFSNAGTWRVPTGGGQSRSGVREMETLGEWLTDTSQPNSQKKSHEGQQESLMQHIQVFCSYLRLLIQQLHAASDRMQQLTAATLDIDSVQSSLAEYQVFQREVSSFQPLTSCVLQNGQLLLRCINTTSPLLRDTLHLIERQSGALQSHTENFLSSILSAMDCLTQPRGDTGDIHGSSL